MRAPTKKERLDHRRQTLEFVDSMLATMQALAAKERYDFLALLIEMATLECKNQMKSASRPIPPPPPTDPENAA